MGSGAPVMRFFVVVVALLFVTGCFTTKINSSKHRLYQLSDMEVLLQDYYANDLKRISPGLACDDFKNNGSVGCFKLIVDEGHGKVIKLIYDGLHNGEKLEVYSFDPPVNYIFIEKIFEKQLKTFDPLPEEKAVTLEDGQPSLRLIVFEKSAVVFYWKNERFNQIWTSD